MDFIEVTINNWEKYNVRCKDYEKPWWFSMNNRILEDGDVYSLTDAEFRAWVYVLSQASLKKSATVKLHAEHAMRVCRVSKSGLKSMIHKFLKISILSESVGSRQDLATTIQNSTEQYITIQNSTIQACDHVLFKVWNDHCGKLPKAKAMSKKRINQANFLLKTNPLDEYWIDVVKRLTHSNFCNGVNDNAWVATFDWFLKPDTHLKALEGAYDNRGGGGKVNRSQQNLMALKSIRDNLMEDL